MDLRARCPVLRPELGAGRDQQQLDRKPWAGLSRAAAIAVAALLGFGLGRDSGPPRFTLTPAGFAALPGWAEDRVAAAMPALLKSCARFRALGEGAPFDSRPDSLNFGRIGDWLPLCRKAAAVEAGDDAAARRFFQSGFAPMAVADYGEEQGLFTGYYEVELQGSLKPHGTYRTPLYRLPPPALERRYSRAQIEDGALAGHGLELLWVKDAIAAFFLQIQGSGRVRLDNGRTVRLGYAGQNGRPYVAVGRLLVERGTIPRDRLTMATIRRWMEQHPHQADFLRRQNPSYVYFRELKGEGPIGAERTTLTAERSLAVDPAYIPLGVPVWIDAVERYLPGKNIRRLVVAQDTGGAIKGPVRGDLFWGTGAEAGRRAGAMNALGHYYLLLPQPVAQRLAASQAWGTD